MLLSFSSFGRERKLDEALNVQCGYLRSSILSLDLVLLCWRLRDTLALCTVLPYTYIPVQGLANAVTNYKSAPVVYQQPTALQAKVSWTPLRRAH